MDKRFCIFDMDGTLVDSMPFWSALGKDYLNALGITPTAEQLAPIGPMTMLEAAAYFMDLFHIPGPPERIVREMESVMEDHYRSDVPLKPGMKEYLETLKARGVRLCIATGSRPFVPPMEGLDTVENQTSFLTLDDARRLDTLLGPGKDKKVLIIGAGLIGLKCAEGILERCASLDIVDLAGRILPNVMLPEPAGIIQAHLESKGIRFHLSDSVVRFTPDTAALKSGKTLSFDVLVVAVGVRPNTELAARAGCTVERGIRVDCRSATGVEGIWAAGDCALSHDISADTDRILALLPNAYFQGETAGRNMAGGDAAFTQAIPMNASGFCGLHMITAGSYEGESYLSREDGSYKLLVTRDDRLVGFILLGEVDRAGIYTALIREETPLSSIDFDLIREKPQLMAFTRAERAKKLGGVKTW